MKLDSDIKSFVMKHGKDNILVCITERNRKGMFFYCELDESRYRVEEGYKIGFKTKDGTFSQSYYQSDFEKLVNDGIISLFVGA